MSEHMKKVNPDARQPRRGGKRLAGKEPHHAPDTARAETTGSAPTAVKPLIPEWEETPAPQAGHGEKRRRRNMREAVRSWQESEGEISPVVTGCQALAEKAKETRRHWRRLVRERRAKRFPESERLPVQLLLLAWGMLPTLGSLLGERVRTRRKQRGERVSALRAKLAELYGVEAEQVAEITVTFPWPGYARTEDPALIARALALLEDTAVSRRSWTVRRSKPDPETDSRGRSTARTPSPGSWRATVQLRPPSSPDTTAGGTAPASRRSSSSGTGSPARVPGKRAAAAGFS